MTGQVKEELLCRFAELGVRISEGRARIQPALLRRREFVSQSRTSGFLDVDGAWHDLTIPADGLGFSWCCIPLIYRLDDAAPESLSVCYDDGTRQTRQSLELSAEDSVEIFGRTGRVRQIEVVLNSKLLFDD